ncbi:NtaA/DmoA family FMN-dependent monooxygenase [Paenibacillus silvae]|uniref:NtaA/DmoA family FMN-dependent monooxygenase n=1 Tax=Paenibacillus silvae TaxID=1325358 RepID=UPI0025A117A2|nr:NtaA/DmoA family FMN-dependent monooxygenase [Paenibacillus silvae]MDM5278707.1 NtaA/DmoA family FMN-dependent monooxygenase [Paenibacillus silvae]
MATKRQLCIGLSLTATWLKGKSWCHEDSQVEKLYSSDFYLELALRAERAKLDFVFKADALLLNTAVIDHTPGFSSPDSTILLASIARETKHIGLITTTSTTFNPPYVVARQLQSLNWISNGRAGWNMVTAIGGAENFSDAPMPSSEERYAKALEFSDVIHKLWQSYPYDALIVDRSTGQYADREKIRAIDHTGEYFSVKGPLNMPAHPSGPLPLLQAGASESGRRFAASVADAVFAATPDIASGIELREDLRRRASSHGRHPDEIRVLPGMYFFLGKTRDEARELYQEAHAHLSTENRYSAVKSILGIDISHLPLDACITADMLPDPVEPLRSQTHANLLRRLIVNEQPSVKDLLSRPEVVGSAYWVVVGTPEDALSEITTWFEAGALDGFIALPGGSLHSMSIFFDELVPMLANKGLFRKEYTGTTLSEHLGIKKSL